jgi:hypothetical protein
VICPHHSEIGIRPKEMNGWTGVRQMQQGFIRFSENRASRFDDTSLQNAPAGVNRSHSLTNHTSDAFF